MLKNLFKNGLKTLLFLGLFIGLNSFWPFSTTSKTITLSIKTAATTNHGTPFYVYVKEVEKGEFLKHEYSQIVKEAFPFTAEGPEIPPAVILPGQSYVFNIHRENFGKLLGVYFLFTKPGDDWKLIVNPSKKIDVTLGETEILSATSK